jgi:hypothetical protein
MSTTGRRARGANATLCGGFEPSYGETPAEFVRLPFVSSGLGAEQGLTDSDLLGYGREALDPTEDVVVADGDLVVPVDARNFGYWLKLFFGPPVSAPTGRASGALKFAGQPAANSTVTVNGTAFSFVTTAPTGPQVQLGADLAATLTNLATALNGSAVSAVALATYTAAAGVLNISAKAAGLAGNVFTLAASATSKATPSAPTLRGGTVAHVFTSGAEELPSMGLEVGQPEVPSYGLNYGAKGNTLRIALSRSGLLNATLGLICQGESVAPAPASGAVADIDSLPVRRFPQAIGSVERNGAVMGNVVSAEFTLSNNLDKAENIRPDGEIDGADEGMVSVKGVTVVRFADTTLQTQAESREPCANAFGWDLGDGMRLAFAVGRVFLPRTKRPVTGPGGVQASYNWQASGAAGATIVATLVNDVEGY